MQDLIFVIKSLDEWASELTRLQTVSAKLSNLQDQSSRSTDEYNELSLRHQQLERRSAAARDQLARHEVASQEKMASLRARTSKQQEQYEQLLADREGLQAEQAAKLHECKVVTEAIEELTKQANNELETAEAAFRELESDVCESDLRE